MGYDAFPAVTWRRRQRRLLCRWSSPVTCNPSESPALPCVGCGLVPPSRSRWRRQAGLLSQREPRGARHGPILSPHPRQVPWCGLTWPSDTGAHLPCSRHVTSPTMDVALATKAGAVGCPRKVRSQNLLCTVSVSSGRFISLLRSLGSRGSVGPERGQHLHPRSPPPVGSHRAGTMGCGFLTRDFLHSCGM